MTDKIIAALKGEGIEKYTISETKSFSVELFFVKKALDLKRRTDLTDYSVTVYRDIPREDGETLLGSSSVTVFPGMGEDELRETLRQAYYAASLAGNQYYELLEGEHRDLVTSTSKIDDLGLRATAKLMAQALFEADVYEDVFVNSAEIFVTGERQRVLNSSGVDVSWERYKVSGEYVIQCIANGQDVETYHRFSYREPDAAALREQVEKALSETRDRAAATRPPKAGSYTVILSGDQLEELFSFYLMKSNAAYVYQHYSDYAAGKHVQGEDVTGDKLTVELVASEPYDSEGVPLVDRTLIKDGVLQTLQGGVRYSRYMGLEPTGSYSAIRIPTGTAPLAELTSKPHLHPVVFSDFQMNPLSGHFAGEIRLAYLYDGETVTPVTGGSVNGSFLDTQGRLTLSLERYRTSTYDGPMAVAIPDVAVAGAE